MVNPKVFQVLSKQFQAIPSNKMATDKMIELLTKGFEATLKEKDDEIIRLKAEVADLIAKLAMRPALLTPQALMSSAPTPMNPFDDAADGADSSGDESTISVKTTTTVTTRRKPRVGTLPVVKEWVHPVTVDGTEYKYTKKGDVYEVNGKNVDGMKGQELRDAWAILHMGKAEGSTSTNMAPNVKLLIRVIKKKMDMLESGNTTWAPTTDFEAIRMTDEMWRKVSVYKKDGDKKVDVSSGKLSVKRADGKTGVQMVSVPVELNALLNIKYKSLYTMQKAVSAELLKDNLYWNNCNNVQGAWRVKRDEKDYPLEEIYTEYCLAQPR